MTVKLRLCRPDERDINPDVIPFPSHAMSRASTPQPAYASTTTTATSDLITQIEHTLDQMQDSLADVRDQLHHSFKLTDHTTPTPPSPPSPCPPAA